MATGPVTPPPGFELEQPASSGIKPPPGFELETPPSQKPGFAARASEQFGLTQHPIDQLIGELQQLRNHPIDTTWEAIKTPIIGLRDLTYNLVRHPIDTVQQVTGGKKFAEDVQSGNYAGAAGTLAGTGIQAALMRGPQATVRAPAVAQTAAERMYQSALKPGPGSYSTAEVKGMVGTGLESRIPVTAQGAQKLDGLIADLNNKVQAQIQYGSKQGITIDPNAVAARADQARTRFATQVNPNADLAAIDASQAEFLKNNPNPIPAAEAQAMKQGTYQQLKGKAYGELKSASVEAQKSLARGIKEELETQFPEIKGLNAQEARFIDLDGALERAIRRIDNHQLIGLGTPLAVGAGGVVTGTPVGAATTGLLKMLFDNPEVKSRVAIALSTASKGGLTLGGARAKIAAYSSALSKAGQSSGPEAP